MATIRRSLQKEVFDITEEKLVGTLHVTKTGKKKKKISFLCAVLNKEKPVYAFIHLVKETEKDSFKKKLSWPLVELQVVDGRDENKETAELDLTFDRVYKWVASSVPEKLSFIQVLWKLCSRYLPKQKPHFVNVSPALLRDDAVKTEGSLDFAQGLEQDESDDESDFCALSEKEQQDLEKLILKSESAVSDAETFAQQLTRDLTMLDGANIHSMMASETQVEALMEMIDLALEEADKIDRRLNSYDEILLHVKDSIEKMAEKNFFIEQTNANNRQLLDTLNHVIKQLDFPSEFEQFLMNPTFQMNNLTPVIEAASALQGAINAPIPHQLMYLQAVKEQKKKFEKIRVEFSKHLARNLNNLFIYHYAAIETKQYKAQLYPQVREKNPDEAMKIILAESQEFNMEKLVEYLKRIDIYNKGNDHGESLTMHAERLTLPRHSNIHSELAPYAPLMHWMRAMEPKAFQKLKHTYAGSMAKLYERDIKLFFDEARHRITGGKRFRGSESSQDTSGVSSVAGKLSSLSHVRSSASIALLGVEQDHWGGELDASERQKFDQTFEQVLSELEPVCLAEQEFCISFFNLLCSNEHTTSTTASSASTPGSNHSDGSGSVTGVPIEPLKRLQPLKHVNRDVRAMMSELFTNLEVQLTSFINTFYKADSYCCLYIYVRLSQHVLSAEDTGSFLSTTFGSCLVQAKRNYDNFMGLQVNSIKECKVTKKKCGIIPFISNFELFAQTGESVFKSSERRGDLDKWYAMLVSVMMDNVPRVAVEHQKTPPEVIKMENYHVLYQLLSQLKLPGLEHQRKEAKQKYQEALAAYVTQYFGRPLEKLNLFFEGVQAKVASGVKESEVGYQLAFSKQELRKVIKEYPGKEVKKGLDHLYKKVEKHLSEEGNLLQVVWRAMQGEFIQQYKNIDDLIHRCYPGAMINLEFSIDDILNYFSDIAQSH